MLIMITQSFITLGRAAQQALFLIVLAIPTALCVAGEGDLDPTFGDGGLVTTDFLGPASDFGQDVSACQADGKIVVVGNT
ncbi:MAG: hypothetical protein ACE5Q3_17635, partial [Alphaproteobacteria bacterium]